MGDIHEPREVPGATRLAASSKGRRHWLKAWVSPGVTAAESAGPGEWLKDRLYPISKSRGTQVCSVIPANFGAYARVLHPARQGSDGQVAVKWSDVARWSGRVAHPEMQWESISRPRTEPEREPSWESEPDVGFCPPDVLLPLVEIVRKYSSGEDGCWACVWEGWGGIGAAFPEVPRIELPWRSHLLFWVPFELLEEGIFGGPGGARISPSLWWPKDHSWCVATEVDFAWTYVGGSQSCIEAVLSDARLEALVTSPQHRGDFQSDQVNRLT
jgi:hypothetical protein